jgi:hypothetical protein
MEEEGVKRRGEGEDNGDDDGAPPPAAKKPKNAWTLTASLIQDLEASMGTGRPTINAMIARRLASSSASSIQPPAPAPAGAWVDRLAPATAMTPPSASLVATPSDAGGSGGGGLKLTFRLGGGGVGGGGGAPSLLEGEEDVFIDYVDGLPGDAGLKIFGKKKQLCVTPAAAEGGEGAAAAAVTKEEAAEEEEIFEIDGEMQVHSQAVGGPRGAITTTKPKRQRTPPPPAGRPTLPPRSDDEVAGGVGLYKLNPVDP